MRQEIVGVGERLQRQMDERAALELRLRQRQKLETVGTLAGGVAHEFNNVLVPILLHTELALEEVANGRPCRDDLECVLDAARRAKRVIDKILAFSRQAGSEEPRPIRLDEPVAAALRLFAVLAPPNVEVRSSLAPDTPLVAADPTLITQAVMNLCTNGWQAMRETGGLLEVNLRALRADEPLPSDLLAGQYVELQVRDTGHGMDEQTRERIFEPFFTTREVGAGTGLGLSVVHGIVTSLGARIHVSSVVGQGTTFQILFPVVAAEPDTASTGVTDP
jgi:signal transduction histidine kinase